MPIVPTMMTLPLRLVCIVGDRRFAAGDAFDIALEILDHAQHTQPIGGIDVERRRPLWLHDGETARSTDALNIPGLTDGPDLASEGKETSGGYS